VGIHFEILISKAINANRHTHMQKLIQLY